MTLGIWVVATGACFVAERWLDLSNLIMIYLLAVSFVASRFGPGEAVMASVLSVAAFDVSFVPPRGHFTVHDSRYIVTFVVMLVVALTISTLAQRLRRNLLASAERERRTAALYALSREIAACRHKVEIAKVGIETIRNQYEVEVSVLLLNGSALAPVLASESRFEEGVGEERAAQWSLEKSDIAGHDTETLPDVKGLYIPLRGSQGAVGVLGLVSRDGEWIPRAERPYLETIANAMGLAIERANFAQDSQDARMQARSEQIKNALLSSISHDLRTPLTAITGAASSLKEGQGDSEQLAGMIYHETVRLNLQIQNLLDMTRLQSGEVPLNLQWHSLEELIAEALQRAQDLLEGRPIRVQVPPDLVLLKVDGELVGKVLLNLLENLAAYTPEGTVVEISVVQTTSDVRLDVADRGPGIPEGQEERIFERFTRQGQTSIHESFGLGLTICRAVMRLHRGRIWAENRRDGTGAVFHVEFPQPATQPEVPVG